MQRTFATLSGFQHQHVDKLIKGRHAYICHFMSAGHLQVRCVCCEWTQCSNKKRPAPTDACLNEGGKGQGTKGGIMLLLYVHLQEGDYFWF